MAFSSFKSVALALEISVSHALSRVEDVRIVFAMDRGPSGIVYPVPHGAFCLVLLLRALRYPFCVQNPVI